MNWRKPIIFSLLRVTGSGIPRNLKQIREWKEQSREQLISRQNNELEDIIRYAATHVPYYREILPKSGVIDANGVVDLSKFNNIPFLTKDILKKRAKDLLSDEFDDLHAYSNHSGGSTGEPTHFYQTKEYSDWNVANKIFYTENLGKYVGNREMKIWGSDRDLLEGTVGMEAILKNWLYNRDFQNAFFMNTQRRAEIADALNTFKPVLVWGYIDCLYEMAEYMVENNITPPKPIAVVCGAGTVYPHMKELIGKAFGAPAINAYGGREVGDMAAECINREGLHIFHHSHYMETINDKLENVEDENGEIVVTAMRNKVMPLIRYRIGDQGTLSTDQCSCGWESHLLKTVTGRVMQTLFNSKGDAIPPEFFIHVVGVTFNTGQIAKFQVIQHSTVELEVKIVLSKSEEEKMPEEVEKNLTETIQKVMGPEANLRYTYVDEIPKTPSGKYLYIIGKDKKELFPEQ